MEIVAAVHSKFRSKGEGSIFQDESSIDNIYVVKHRRYSSDIEEYHT